MVLSRFINTNRLITRPSLGAGVFSRDIFVENEKQLRAAIGRIVAGEGVFDNIILTRPIQVTETVTIPDTDRKITIVGSYRNPIICDDAVGPVFTVSTVTELEFRGLKVRGSYDNDAVYANRFISLASTATLTRPIIVSCDIGVSEELIEMTNFESVQRAHIVGNSIYCDTPWLSSEFNNGYIAGNVFNISRDSSGDFISVGGRFVGNKMSVSGDGTFVASDARAIVSANEFTNTSGTLDFVISGNAVAFTGNAFYSTYAIDCTGTNKVVVSGNTNVGTITPGTATLYTGLNS